MSEAHYGSNEVPLITWETTHVAESSNETSQVNCWNTVCSWRDGFNKRYWIIFDLEEQRVIHPATERSCREMAGSGTRTGKMSLEDNSSARCSRNGRGQVKRQRSHLVGRVHWVKVIWASTSAIIINKDNTNSNTPQVHRATQKERKAVSSAQCQLIEKGKWD